MARVVRLTERDLSRIVKRVIREMEDDEMGYEDDMMYDDMMGGEMEEGLFGPSKSEMIERRRKLKEKLKEKLVELGVEEKDLHKSLEATLNAAEEDNYKGDEIVVKRAASDGKLFLKVKSPESKFHQSKFYRNVMQPMVGGMKGGHNFGGGPGN